MERSNHNRIQHGDQRCWVRPNCQAWTRRPTCPRCLTLQSADQCRKPIPSSVIWTGIFHAGQVCDFSTFEGIYRLPIELCNAVNVWFGTVVKHDSQAIVQSPPRLTQHSDFEIGCRAQKAIGVARFQGRGKVFKFLLFHSHRRTSRGVCR